MFQLLLSGFQFNCYFFSYFVPCFCQRSRPINSIESQCHGWLCSYGSVVIYIRHFFFNTEIIKIEPVVYYSGTFFLISSPLETLKCPCTESCFNGLFQKWISPKQKLKLKLSQHWPIDSTAGLLPSFFFSCQEKS